MKFSFAKFINECATGNLQYVNTRIKQHPNINYRNEKGWNAIIVACYGHFYDVVSVLLANGADINSTNYKGTTVFMYAKTKCLETSDYRFLDYLLLNGANINAEDNKGLTVLDYVEILNNKQMIDYLITKGAATSAGVVEKK
jgi:ankyrin repeat protein